jgi:hypothetical protein
VVGTRSDNVKLVWSTKGGAPRKIQEEGMSDCTITVGEGPWL